MVEQKYIDYWRARQAEQKVQIQRWEQEAWVDLKVAVLLLRAQFGVTKAIVFGSLVRDRFGEDSDIDLAVKGLAKADFFEALAAVNAQSKRWIDLKPMESLDPRFKERVLSTGRVVDENL